ncbi:hypothetical protein BDK51DRAFT_50158, partial [Blyttiomyces helicus]
MSPVAVAVARDRWGAVRLLVGAGFPTVRAVDVACKFGAELGLIKYLISLGHDDMATPAAIHYAAFWDRIRLVLFLRSRGLAVTSEHPIAYACSQDRDEMVTCLIGIGAPVPDGAGEDRQPLVGQAGCSLEVVRFLHENRSDGCTTSAMDTAAAKWAFYARLAAEQLDSDSFDVQVRHFKAIFINLHHKNRSEGCTTKAMDLAAIMGQTKIVPFLQENRREGCPDSAVLCACSRWANSAKLARETTDDEKAKHERDIEKCNVLLSFLHRHYTEHFSELVITAAGHYDRVEVVLFLVALNPESYAHIALKFAYSSGRADTLILRALYKDGHRFTNDKAKRMLDPTYSMRLTVGVEAVLREIHGLHS